MVNALLEGVAAAIRSEFGRTDYAVYCERVPQGVRLPCFFVRLKEQRMRPGVGTRFVETDEIEVVYTPGSSGMAQAECQTAAVALGILLSKVQVGTVWVWGRNLHSRIVEGKLIFSAAFRFDLYWMPESSELMQEVVVYDRNRTDAEDGGTF